MQILGIMPAALESGRFGPEFQESLQAKQQQSHKKRMACQGGLHRQQQHAAPAAIRGATGPTTSPSQRNRDLVRAQLELRNEARAVREQQAQRQRSEALIAELHHEHNPAKIKQWHIDEHRRLSALIRDFEHEKRNRQWLR